MDGFKNTTKTQYSMGGYAKGGSKFGKVMGEFKAGTLHSGSKKGPEVTNPKQAIAIGLSEARKAGAKFPVKKQLGGPALTAQQRAALARMTPAERDMSLETSRAISQRAQENKMQGAKRGVVVNTKPATKPATRNGAMSDLDRRTMEEPSAPYKKGGKVKPTTRTADALRAQKYKAAMASRPNRNPRVIPAKNAAQVQAAAAGMRNALEKAISTRAAQQNAAQAAPQAAAPPMEAAAPPMMGAPAMKKGGKVMKKANGGMASSIRSPADYNASDKDFIAARADQIKALVGPKMKEGGKVDLKQDKALVKKAVHKHEASMHPGKPLTKLRKGGMAC